MLRRIRRDDWWGDEPGEIVAIPLGRKATIEDLGITKLKAEIVNGELIVIGPPCWRTARAAGKLSISLHDYADRHGGYASGSLAAYIVDLPHRLAICPDASWFAGPAWDDFPRGAPTFAVEIRERSEHGPDFESRFAAKRADYFAAGTQVVWDVDVLGGDDVVRVHRAGDPENPTIYRRGEMAEAEPAVPGWRMPVDELFD